MSMTAKEHLNFLRTWILNAAAEANTYTWDDGYKVEKLRAAWEIPDSVQGMVPLTVENLRSLTEQELRDYGFVPWEDNHLCIPLWIYPHIAPDEYLKSISGDIAMAKDCDTDNRFGCIAWGFHYVQPEAPEKDEPDHPVLTTVGTYVVHMESPGGQVVVTTGVTDPTPKDLNNLAQELGWKVGDPFPGYDCYDADGFYTVEPVGPLVENYP